MGLVSKIVLLEVIVMSQFEPIPLNEFGESFAPYGKDECKLPRSADAARPHAIIGIHDHCGGGISIFSSSESFLVLFCSKCCLRIGNIPFTTGAFGDLRQELQERVCARMWDIAYTTICR